MKSEFLDDHPPHPSATEHRALGHGGLRAAVFGASDGLVSNTALVMGVAAGSGQGEVVVLAGIAGWLAGAFSMAVGEWISVTAQREALERELAREKDHLERYPEAERRHIAEVLERAGLSARAISGVVKDLERDPHLNLDFHARMELGIDPDELGSPGLAAGASFVAFSLGALIPLAPWLMMAQGRAYPVSMVVSVAALFAVGAGLARFTGRHWAWSGARQTLLGSLAAALTMAIGSLVGAPPT